MFDVIKNSTNDSDCVFKIQNIISLYKFLFTLWAVFIKISWFFANAFDDWWKNFRVKFSLKNIFMINKFVTQNIKMKRLKKKLLSDLTHKMRRKMFVLHEFDEIEKIQFVVKFVQKYHTNYHAIFWINDSIKIKLKQNIINLINWLSQDQIFKKSKNDA